MINILERLFGSDEVISKAVDGAYNGLDALVFTDEEKTENFNKQLKLYEPFKLAQRLLALIFAIPYTLGWVAVFVAGFFTETPVEVLAFQLELLKGTMGQIVLAIIGFYFLGGTVNSFRNKE